MIDEYMLDFYRHRAEPRPGALEFVQGLAQAGAHLTVASSSPKPYLMAGIERCGFAPYLERVLSVEDVHSTKREPDVWDRAREIMGTSKQLTWGVEDSAYAIGTLAGGVFGDRFGRKYVIWFSILGAAPFAIAMPYVSLTWTIVFTFLSGLIIASAFSSIVVYATDLMPDKVGLIAGIFFGLMFGLGGIGSAFFGWTRRQDQRRIHLQGKRIPAAARHNRRTAARYAEAVIVRRRVNKQRHARAGFKLALPIAILYTLYNI